MNYALANVDFLAPSFPAFSMGNRAEEFRQRFKCALIQCVRRGFCVEEAFGVIWEETIEAIELSYSEQETLYPELIDWAKGWMR